MDTNSKGTKHTWQISRRIHSVRNSEEWNLHKTVWCEVGLQMEDIGTKNVREDRLNSRLGYDMLRLKSWQNTCQKEWQDTENSEEQCVLNELNGLRWGLNSMSLKCSYGFRMLNLI